MSAATSVDLPAPGRPRDPDEVRAAGQWVQAPERGLCDRRCGSRRPSAAARAHAGRPPRAASARDSARAAGHSATIVARPTLLARRALARMKSATSRIVVPGPNTAATPSALSGPTSSSGMIPPTVTRTSSRPFS